MLETRKPPRVRGGNAFSLCSATSGTTIMRRVRFVVKRVAGDARVRPRMDIRSPKYARFATRCEFPDAPHRSAVRPSWVPLAEHIFNAEAAGFRKRNVRRLLAGFRFSGFDTLFQWGGNNFVSAVEMRPLHCKDALLIVCVCAWYTRFSTKP